MIEERKRAKRLAHYNLVVDEVYRSEGKTVHRISDGSRRDDVRNGALITRIYYQDQKEIGRIANFDPRILYTYVSDEDDHEEVTCPNCGSKGTVKEMRDGCPYCGAEFNMSFEEKEMDSKRHYDVAGQKGYQWKTFLMELIGSFLVSFFFIKFTSRTFNSMDILKILVMTAVLTLVLFFAFLRKDAQEITDQARAAADKRNAAQRIFWNQMEHYGINKATFFNNTAFELRNYYFGKTPENADLVDFNIVDYLAFKEEPSTEHALRVRMDVRVREARYANHRIRTAEKTRNFLFERSKDKTSEKIMHAGMNAFKCRCCGAPIDITAPKCGYCDAPIRRYQEWYLVQ